MHSTYSVLQINVSQKCSSHVTWISIKLKDGFNECTNSFEMVIRIDYDLKSSKVQF